MLLLRIYRCMKDKDLIAKLKRSQSICPDSNWLSANRDLLLNQIENSGAAPLKPFQSFLINLKCFSQALSKPVLASLVFLLVVFTSAAFSHQIFSQAKPNDLLYTARVMTEKARLNTVIGSESRDKLAAQFASSHAQEISEILADPEFNREDNQAQVEKLSNSLVKEIATVETKMAKLQKGLISPTPLTSNLSTSTEVQAEPDISDEDLVSIASDPEEKDEQGIEIHSSSPSEEPEIDSDLEVLFDETISNLEPQAEADNQELITTAKELYSKQQYLELVEVLKEIEALIN